MGVTALLLSGLLGTGCFWTLAEVRRDARERKRLTEDIREDLDRLVPKAEKVADNLDKLVVRVDGMAERSEPLLMKILAGMAGLIVMWRAGAICRAAVKAFRWKGGALKRLGSGLWRRLCFWRRGTSGAG